MRKIPDLDHRLRSLAENGETELLREEITRTPDIVKHCDEFGWTLLHRAAHFGYASTVEMLLELNANVNAMDLKRDTPLHDAATGYEAHVPVMALLVSRGAQINARNTAWKSPIMICTQYSNLTGFAFLLGCGARLDFKDRCNMTILHELNYQVAYLPKGKKYARQRQDLKAMLGWAEVLCNRKE